MNTIKKRDILDKLHHTYCRLGISPIEGVGVFAIRDIPEDVDPFYGSGDPDAETFTPDELKDLHPEVLRLITDFLVYNDDGSVEIPHDGIYGLTIAFYLNHSEQPNVITPDDGISFRTKRLIKKGEELTANYETYDPKDKEFSVIKPTS